MSVLWRGSGLLHKRRDRTTERGLLSLSHLFSFVLIETGNWLSISDRLDFEEIIALLTELYAFILLTQRLVEHGNPRLTLSTNAAISVLFQIYSLSETQVLSQLTGRLVFVYP